MKKALTFLALLVVGLNLTACGNNSKQAKENSSLKAENSSLKKKSKSKQQQIKMSDEEFAMAAYLKLADQSVDEIKNDAGNMHWSQNSNKYSINFGAHTTVMTVNKNSVEVTYDKTEGDHMGSGNGHKTYSKRELSQKYGKDEKKIDDLLSGKKAANNSSTNSGNNSQANNNNQSNNQNSHVVTNANGSKSIVEDGKTFTPKYNENGQIDYWQVKLPNGQTFIGGDPSPSWQEKERQIQQ